MSRCIQYLKKDVILTAALLLALLSCLLVTPDSHYIGYIDFGTLILLFCLMLVVENLRALNFFDSLAQMALRKTATVRQIVWILVFLCFFSAMFVTNDVALITFVPFGILILNMAGTAEALCPAVVLMTLAANLGSMLTPIGNPQNLYLYSVSGLGMPSFLSLMLPYSALSVLLLVVFILLKFRPAPMELPLPEPEPLDRKKILYCLFLFSLCLLSVAGWLPKPLLLVLIIGFQLPFNRRAFASVDYSLLFTFIGFFIFVGNMNRLEVLHQLISRIIRGRECLVSIACSQVISNVPSAVLLSGYTEKTAELIVGTNLGGLGTLIASMASLISYKHLCAAAPRLKKRYLLLFTRWNLLFMIVLFAFYLLLSELL